MIGEIVAAATFNAPYTSPNLLATFMWRRPLNSVVLVVATHRRLRRVSDGTSTRVVAYIINKLRAKISQKRLYNVRDPPRRRRRFICESVEKTL